MKKVLILILFLPSFSYALCGVADVIPVIRPGAVWSLNGTDLSGLIWQDAVQIPPSKTEISAAIAACQSQVAADASTKAKAVADAKNSTLPPPQRLDALISALNLQ